MKKSVGFVLAVCFVILTITGCNANSTAPTEQPAEVASIESPSVEVATGVVEPQTPEDLPILRVSLLPYMNALPVLYMIEKWYDVELGYKIETSVYSLGAPMLEALASDLWDVGSIGTGAAPMSVTTYDSKIIGDVLINCNRIFVRKDSAIAKVKGANPDFPEIYGNAETVKGATVLVATGSVQQQLVLVWLDKLGLTQNDVKFVHMEPPSAYQAFIAGEGDIIAAAPPYNFQLDDDYLMAADFGQMDVRLADVLIVNPKSYDSKKELLVKFVRGFYKAADELIADPELMAQKELEWKTENGMKTTLEECREEVAASEMISSTKALESLPGKSIEMIAQFLAKQGKIEEAALEKFNTALTDEIIKEALKP